LTSNNIEKSRNGHHNDTEDNTTVVNIGFPEVSEHHGKGNFREYAQEEGWQGEEQTRLYAPSDLIADIDVVTVTFAKIEPEETDGFLVKDCLVHLCKARLLCIDKKGKMIVVFLFPPSDSLRGDIFFSQNFNCHIIGGVNIKKEEKYDYVNSGNDRDGIEKTADDVSYHFFLSNNKLYFPGGPVLRAGSITFVVSLFSEEREA
jgi:hypothetical protein